MEGHALAIINLVSCVIPEVKIVWLHNRALCVVLQCHVFIQEDGERSIIMAPASTSLITAQAVQEYFGKIGNWNQDLLAELPGLADSLVGRRCTIKCTHHSLASVYSPCNRIYDQMQIL